MLFCALRFVHYVSGCLWIMCCVCGVGKQVMTDLNPNQTGIRHIHPLTIVDAPTGRHYWAFNLTSVETTKMLFTYHYVTDIPVLVGVGSSPKRAAKHLLSLMLDNGFSV